MVDSVYVFIGLCKDNDALLDEWFKDIIYVAEMCDLRGTEPVDSKALHHLL